jgi:hypothetical protein
MRRAQAIIALLTLAALPLIPLAQATQMSGCTCKGMPACCMRHSMHSGASRGEADHKVMYCQRHAGQNACCCGMMSPQNELRVALAPIPPTRLSASKLLSPPSIFRSAIMRSAQHASSGFLSDFFQPPRPESSLL